MSDAAPSQPNQPTPSEALAEILRGRRGVRAALDRLERAVAAPSAGREEDWIGGVLERLGELQAAFNHHIAITEGQGGLFEEIVDHSPRLVHHISALGAEHATISDALAATLSLGNSAKGPGGAAETREAAIEVMNHITRHRNSGAGLLYEAYSVDIEAAD